MPYAVDPRKLVLLRTLADAPHVVAGAREAALISLRRRACYLETHDRLMWEAHAVHGLSARVLAAELGVHHGTVARRLTAIRGRLCDPRVVALCDAGDTQTGLGRRDRTIALRHLVGGRRLRDVAAEVGLTLPLIRQRLLYVRGWLQGRRDAARAINLARDATRRPIHEEDA